jgi:hypothetical protein
MLVNRANELQTAIKTVQERGRRLEYVQGIQSLAQKLTERAAEISGLLACRSALAERGCDFAPAASLTKTAAEGLRSMRRRLEADATASADPGSFAPTLLALNRIVVDLRSALRSTWTAYVDDRIPSLNPDVLDVLRRIGDLRHQVSRVEQRLRDLKLRRDVLPLRPEEIAAFDAGVQEIGTLWHTLGGDSLPGEVLRFLQSSGTGGAALDSLTPVVTEWLRDHRLWTAFRITIARETAGPNSSRRPA